MRKIYLNYSLILLLLILSPHIKAIERVVSLSPSATELIYAAGLGDKLVAVSSYSNYPAEAKHLEKVAGVNSINIERIIALKPDLIVAWRSGAPLRALDQLQSLGFTIYYSDITQLAEIPQQIEELSQFSDNPKVGEQNARIFRYKLHELRDKYRNKEPVSYFYQLDRNPMFSVAQNHWPSEVLNLCGGRNIFANAAAAYPQVGIEQIIAYAPEVIFTSSSTAQDTQAWHKWQHIPAVKNQRIHSLNADWLDRPGPRSLKAVEQVCHFLDSARAKINQKD